jgi:hypothetical protein
MGPVFKEVDGEKLFLDGLARERGKLALTMILHGQFPSAGWRVAECIWRDGSMLRYSCFPMAPPK